MRDAGEILQAVFNSFIPKLEARKGFSLPTRRYIHVGQVAYDQEQFVVQGLPIYQGLPGQQRSGYDDPHGGIAIHSFDVAVQLVRAIPGPTNRGAAPSSESLTKASLALASDGTALTETFYAAVTDNSLAGPCDIIYFGGITFPGPLGGMQGCQLACSFQL